MVQIGIVVGVKIEAAGLKCENSVIRPNETHAKDV
jgi:hypothetical protein